MRRRRRVTVTSALGALCLVLLLGCGADPDEPSGDPSSATSEAPAGETSAGTSEDLSESGVEPASGEEVSTDHVTLRMPERWRVTPFTDSLTDAVPPRLTDNSSITVRDQAVPGGAEALDLLAREALRNVGIPRYKPEILDPVVIAGVEAYHIGGRTSSAQYYDEYGVSVAGALVSLKFSLPTINPRAERQELIASILATVEWDL